MTRHNPTVSKKAVTITAAAQALHVTREHLSRVLNGQRASRSLIQRYRDFVRQQQETSSQ